MDDMLDEDLEELGYVDDAEPAGSDTHVPMIEPSSHAIPAHRTVAEHGPAPGPGVRTRRMPDRLRRKGIAHLLVTMRNGAQVLYK